MPAADPTVPPGLRPLGGTPPLGTYLREAWQRRAFSWASAVGDLRAQHMDTALGNLWHLLNPALMIAVYYLIFGVVLGIDRSVDNFIGFLAVGVLAYQWSQKSAISGARAIISGEGLIRSLQFPRLLLPLATILKETLAFLPGVPLMLVVVVVTELSIGPDAGGPINPISWAWLLIVPVFFIQVAFNLGVSLFTARLSDRFRDTVNLLPFIFRLIFYASGVLYPISDRFTFFEARPWLTELATVNPFYSLIGLWRDALMVSYDAPTLDLMWISVSVWTVVLVIGGVLLFRAGEKEFGRG